MDYFVTIGIEIHAELKTNSKMFSPGKVTYDEIPNTNVNAIDMAFPGTLPSINKEAVRMGLKVCYALNMEIDSLLKFDRKNYFYSDLPKGFQITQQFHPIGRNGKILLDDGSTVRINRLHLEEDTAKQVHIGEETLIDFNRAGVPLAEIVSEPDIHSGEQAANYVENLRQILIYLDVCDGKMAEGSMRCDVNVSISPDKNVFGTKVEIKNLNSINNIKKAIDSEILRQQKLIEAGKKVEQETRRFDEESQTTVLMRKKEKEINYRYYPEPNIFPIQLKDDFLKEVKDSMVELPKERLARLEKQIDVQDSKILVENKKLGDFYDEVMKYCKKPQSAANFVISQVSPQGIEGYNPEQIGNLIEQIESKRISGKQGKDLLRLLKNSEKTVDELIQENGMKMISDDSEILNFIEKILDENPKVIEDYKNGKDRSVKFVMGQLMKMTRGQANPVKANELIIKVLKEK